MSLTPSSSYVREAYLVFVLHLTARLTVNFLAIIPLAKLFEYGGEQMSYYVGKELGDLIIISLNKYALLPPSLLRATS